MSIVYSPREDSDLIYKEVKKRADGRRVLDVGTGSGILALGAKRGGAIDIVAVDINPDAVEFAKKKGINAIESDLFSNVKGKFDLIAFNPPYLPEDLREDGESKLITTGGEKGDEITLRFLEDAGRFLNPNGEILLLVSNLTSLKRIEAMIKKKGYMKEVVSSQKLFYEELFVWRIWR